MAEIKVNQVISRAGKRWKVVELRENGMVKLKCMVCGSKYLTIHKDQL